MSEISSIDSLGVFDPIALDDLPRSASPYQVDGTSSLKSAPPPSPIRRLIDLQQQMEDVLSTQISQSEIAIQQNQAELDRLEQEKEKAFKKHADKVASSDSWGTLTTVARMVGGSGAIVSGVAIGGWVGGVLASLGALEITNKVVSATIGWQAAASYFTDKEELQKLAAERIERFGIFVTLGMGAFGAVAAYQSFALGASALAKLGSTIATASSLIGAAAQLGQSFDSKEISHLRADTKEIGGKETLLHQDTSDIQRRITDMLETNAYVTDTAKDAILASAQH